MSLSLNIALTQLIRSKFKSLAYNKEFKSILEPQLIKQQVPNVSLLMKIALLSKTREFLITITLVSLNT